MVLTPKKIVVLDISNNVYVEILEGYLHIKDELSYEGVYWIKDKFKKRRKTYTRVLIKDKRYFYLGFLERIKRFCTNNKIFLVLKGEQEFLTPSNEPYLEGVTFRDYQPKFINAAIEKQRGILVAIMAAGKTFLAVSIVSCFKDCKVLFLCHEKDLMHQAKEEFDKFGYSTSLLGDGNKDIDGDIVCATTHSAKNLDFDKVSHLFDIIFADEAHVGIKEGGMLDKILSNTFAPIKLGLTATPPKEKETILMSEGLLGPILQELSYKDAKEEGIVADVNVEIIDVPTIKNINGKILVAKTKDNLKNNEIKKKNKLIKDKKKRIKIINKTNYQYHYQVGITENEIRNKLIIENAIKLADDNKSCIIFARSLDHIKILSKMLEAENMNFEAVYGNITTDERKRIKKGLSEKKVKIVIASVVWVAGINIPSLDGIINAAGEKDYKALFQKAGRSARKHGDKIAIVIDFYDKGIKYLEDHSKIRIEEYKKLGWIK